MEKETVLGVSDKSCLEDSDIHYTIKIDIGHRNENGLKVNMAIKMDKSKPPINNELVAKIAQLIKIEIGK